MYLNIALLCIALGRLGCLDMLCFYVFGLLVYLFMIYENV